MGRTKKPAKRAYQSARRAVQKEETREAILDAALKLFAERGFEAASIRDIALRADISHAVIRQHFGAKDDLWRAAVEQMFARFAQEMDADSWGGNRPLPERLEAFLRNYVIYCARHPEHVRIMMHESLGESERLDWMVENYIAPAHRSIEPLLRAAMDAGHVPQMPVISLVYTIAAAAQSLFALGAEARRIYGVDTSAAAAVSQHAEALVSLFVAHRTAPSVALGPDRRKRKA
ncbi:MAG: TetR/AcrR family transcriptional regulator [Terricaulis sp.]|jgi:AcrR family transcriptional regulator